LLVLATCAKTALSGSNLYGFKEPASTLKFRFRECYTCFGCETKTGVIRIFFFKIDLCSAISFKRSRRELSIDVAENMFILKDKGVERILVIFQDRPMFSNIIKKAPARAFH